MSMIPAQHGIWIAAILFLIGLLGVMVRRDILFVLMSIEVMLNAAGLAFIAAAAQWKSADGQVMYIFILAMAATEVAVGLALVLLLYQRFKSLDTSVASGMRG